MSMKKFAEKELKTLAQKAEEMDDYETQKHINDDILELIEMFSNQGHSEFSAAYVIKAFYQLVQFKPITPLIGSDDEWINQGRNDGEVIEQNKRCSSVFRTDYDNSTAYDIYGKVFSDDGGKTWYTNKDSKVPVKFPYTVPNEPERIILEVD